MVYKYDYLVIGSGIAGMSFALKAARRGRRVAVICKTTLEEANTALAQGGVASVTDLKVDNFDKHIEDTMIAGDWLSGPRGGRKVVRGAPEQIRELIGWGVGFDKKEDGSFDLHREGGHSEFRILHHADNTGFEIQNSLVKRMRSSEKHRCLRPPLCRGDHHPASPRQDSDAAYSPTSHATDATSSTRRPVKSTPSLPASQSWPPVEWGQSIPPPPTRSWPLATA